MAFFGLDWSALTGGLFGDTGILSNPSNAWDTFINGRTNQVAEEQYEYQKSLQNILFEREDTAHQRTVDDMSKAGLNPLTLNPNRNDAGQVAVTPNASFTPGGAMQAMSGIMGLVNGISNLNSQGLQRDSIREQNDYQRLLNQEKQIENTILANKNGVTFDNNGNPVLSKDFVKEQDKGSMDYRNSTATTERNERENNIQRKYGGHDMQSTVNAMAVDAQLQADRVLNGLNNEMATSDATSTALGLMLQSLSSKIKDTGDDIGNWFQNAWNNDKRRINNAGNAIKKGASKVGNGIKNTANKIFNSINSSYQNSTYRKNKGR